MLPSSKPLEMSPVPVSEANAPPWVRADEPRIPAVRACSIACWRASCGSSDVFCILYWPSARSESFLPILPSSRAIAVPVPPDSSAPSSGLSSSSGGGGSSCDALLVRVDVSSSEARSMFAPESSTGTCCRISQKPM